MMDDKFLINTLIIMAVIESKQPGGMPLEDNPLFVASERIKQLNAERDAALAQLVEVQNNCTGVSPCERFCEALATKKMFDNLQSDNRKLKVQVEQLREQLEYMAQQHRCGCGHPACNRCYDDKQNAIVLEATPAQCLAEIKAQAVVDAIDAHKNRFMTFGFDTAIRVNDLIKYANQLRQQAKGE